MSQVRNIVPHDLITKVNAPIELEEKARRLARLIYTNPHRFPSHEIITDLKRGLITAHARQFGKSSLTEWRIVTEWNDNYALMQLIALLNDELSVSPRPRLRSWELHH